MKSILFTALLFLLSVTTHAQDFALQQLEESPRHHEWVQVEYDGRSVHSFVAYPQTSENTLSVIVIHENRGLTDWVRSFADRVAEAGYIAIAPDLLSNFNEDHQRTSDFESSDAARDALYTLEPGQITDDLKAVQEYISNVPSSNGTIVVAGFCWGGSQTFRFATNSDMPAAFMVFYGSAPDEPEAVQRISSPVYGFYGENDQRINSGIPAIEEMMNEFGKRYDYEIYDDAGHAFMRSGANPDGPEANREAREAAWERLKELFKEIE